MHNNLAKIVRVAIIFWGIYFLFESFLYLSHVRLTDIKTLWLPAAAAYAKFIESMLGSVFLFLSAAAFELQRNLQKYKKIIVLSAPWAIFHGGLLIYLSKGQNYVTLYASTPSLYVWSPFYNSYLLFEGILALLYAVVVLFWFKESQHA